MIINDNARQYFWVSWNSVMSPSDCLYKLQSPHPSSYITYCPFLWPWICHHYRRTCGMGKYLCPIHKMRTEWDLCLNIWKSLAKWLSLVCAFADFNGLFCGHCFKTIEDLLSPQASPVPPSPFKSPFNIDHYTPSKVLLGSKSGSPFWKRRQCSPAHICTPVLSSGEGCGRVNSAA